MKHMKLIASVAIIATMVAIIALNAYIKINERTKENSMASAEDSDIEEKKETEETDINMSYVAFDDVKDSLSGNELLAAIIQGKSASTGEVIKCFHGYSLIVNEAYITDDDSEFDSERFDNNIYSQENIEFSYLVVKTTLTKNTDNDDNFCVGSIRPYTFDKNGNVIGGYELGEYVNNTQDGKSSWMQYLDNGEERECILAYAVPKAELSMADKMLIQINPFGNTQKVSVFSK